MKERRIAGLLILCLGCVSLQCAAAADTPDSDDPPYLVEYRAYRQAARAGDIDAAVRHARAAWQSAETLLGDDRHTATLAFNFGRLQLYRDALAALPALRRADELQQSGIAQLPAAELRLFLAYAEYQTSGRTRSDLRSFRKSLEASSDELSDGSIDLADIWIALMTEDFTAGRWADTVDSAARADAALRAAAPDDLEALVKVILAGGAARLLLPRWTEKQILAAHHEFERAQRLFPPQQDIEHFDPLLAQVLAWDAAALAVYRTRYHSGFPDAAADDEQPMPPVLENSGLYDPRCGEIEWQARKSPEYPDAARSAGYIGAVIVGYNLDEDLRVSEPKVLAEVPARKFGHAAASSMSDWQAAPPASDDPVCRRNLLSTFTFVMN